MTDDGDYEFFRLRKEGKTYISKVFTWNARDEEPRRSIRMVLANNDSVGKGDCCSTEAREVNPHA